MLVPPCVSYWSACFLFWSLVVARPSSLPRKLCLVQRHGQAEWFTNRDGDRLSQGLMECVINLSVYFRLAWVDPRLTSDLTKYDSILKTRFWIGSGSLVEETLEI